MFSLSSTYDGTIAHLYCLRYTELKHVLCIQDIELYIIAIAVDQL